MAIFGLIANTTNCTAVSCVLLKGRKLINKLADFMNLTI